MNRDPVASLKPETPEPQPGSEEGSPRPDPDVTGTILPDVHDGTPHTFIGPYGFVRQFGEGGMGVVFHARQFQPIHRDVALKVIKPGMASGQVIPRFEGERQALAVLGCSYFPCCSPSMLSKVRG